MSDDPSPELPTRTGSFRAIVRVGQTVVEYSRAGCGRPVVLIGTATAGLKQALSRHFRLVVPESVPESDLAGWLRCFLDGLGLIQVDLVAEEQSVPPVLEFARLEPERVGRLVLLSRPGQVDRDGLRESDDSPGVDLPVLTLRGLPSEDLAGDIVRFLLAEGAS